MNEQNKTFEKLGIFFDKSDCITCRSSACHNIVFSKRNGIEYSVHISANFRKMKFYIVASESANSFSNEDIDEVFTNEHDAVDFLCKNFEKFTCL